MAIKRWIGTDGNYNTAGNWSPSGVPSNTDTVRIPAGAADISSGLTQSGVSLTAFIVEEGCTATIGTAAASLEITTSRFEFSGSGQAWIDLKASAVSPQVFNTFGPGEGEHGLYLIGSGLAVLNVVSGNVGVAVRAGETATITTARVVGSDASLTLGTGVTLTSLQQNAGSSVQRCASTTTTVYGGSWRSRETGTITTLNAYGGSIYPESTGTITTLLVQGAEVDFTLSGAARTVTNCKHNSGTLTYDPAALTITNRNAPDFPVRSTTTLAA